MRIQALHCPACGAPIEVPPGSPRATCSYCAASLAVANERVTDRSGRPSPPARPEDPLPFPQPPATLYTYASEGSRFELSVVEQELPERVPDLFTPVDLGEHRFALVYLRAVDSDGQTVAAELAGAFAALRASLEDDADPGLAANLALEALGKKGFVHKLECAVLLFEPRHMTMTGYSAGCRDSVVWVSSEEGRSIVPGGDHPALERKMLREARDYFSNMRPIRLAASDLVVFTSAGYAGRGKGGSGTARGLFDALNEHLGEEPLRIVTLA
ncbi:MAG: TFIIB-type zinc ribbon-containing protein, partial [Myxococcaceae bacterium]